jgi:hypothetical protein
MPPVGERGNALDNIAATADFQYMASESIWTFFRNHYWRLWLVLRPRRSASRPAATTTQLAGFLGSGVGVLGFAIVSAIFVFRVLLLWGGVAGAAIGGSGVCVTVVVVVVEGDVAVHEFLLSSRSEPV